MQSVSMPQTVSDEQLSISNEQLFISNEQLFAKLCEVQALLEAQRKEDKRGLWNIQDIANYTGFTDGHIRINIVADPRFPAPVDFQGRAGKRAKRLWLKQEVINFCERHKVKKVRV